ncbi:discoidin domain-containing protein [Paraglaciecola aquimarina]|uniref:Discoidin domain-containing protein n=1 Tax=Paraglaciecola algarum TaxID=3050085 RepID=A0ABS9DAI5_9ALTE|nr:discoidin domain-containing protein [Paraglaciecola sp. G1-23]MCF2949027.1 discoidin domain-containing protein [Paraglaciecola sp. G1-23]
MKILKPTILGLGILTNCALAESTIYQSIANELTIDSAGVIKVKVLLVNETDEITCSHGNYDFLFNLESIIGQKWYDTLLLSRNANSLIDFIYDNTSCTLLALKLPKLYEHGDNVNEPGKGLKETGEYGNVALIGSNILTDANYSTNSHYGQDVVTAAFDGYTYSTKSNSDATDKISRGIWLHKIIDEADEEIVKPWLQVDFNKNVTLVGLAIFMNQQSLELGRSPRYATLYTSLDGVDFEKIENLSFSFDSPASGNFSSPITSRFFRLVIDSNYGDNRFIEVDELEFYQ